MPRTSRRPAFIPPALLRILPRLRVIAALALLIAAPAQAYASAQRSSCAWGDGVPAAQHAQAPSATGGAAHATAHLPTVSEGRGHDLGTGEVAAVSAAPCGGSALIGGTSASPLTTSTRQCVRTPAPPPEEPAAGDLFHPPRLS